jgi:heptosyltransferase-2
MNIAVLLPNWIGDAVMATPTLRALHHRFGHHANITGIMRPLIAQVLAGTPWLDQTIYYDHHSRNPDLKLVHVLRQLKSMPLDTMLLLPNSFRSGLMAWLSGAPRRVGYARYGRGKLLTDRLHPARHGKTWIPTSAVNHYLDLAYAIGCPPESRKPELATSAEDELRADRVWRNLDLWNAKRVILLNTGSVRGSAKHWPAEYYVRLAHKLVEDPQNTVLVICGPAERQSALQIERTANHARIRSMAHQNLELGVAKACIRRSHLMVTTDSGPRHIATAFDVPVVAIFGPIDPRWSETYHPQSINLLQPVSCGPCGHHVCPFEHHRCMQDLSVDRVYAAVNRLLYEEHQQVASVA